MVKVIYIAVGGAIGVVLRYLLSGLDYKYFYGIFPVGTLVVNLSGAFLIGLFWGLFESVSISANIRLFLFIGLLGGFTTFSTFALESFNLFRSGENNLALLNILFSNFLGLLFVYSGYLVARIILKVVR